MNFTSETRAARRRGVVGADRGVASLAPPGSVVDGLGAVVMAVCEMRGKAASMVVMWPAGARPAEFGVMRRVAAELGVDPAKAAARVPDDDRSVAADSWSIKSDYGSTLDDEQRYTDAAELLLTSSSSACATAPSASVSANPSSDFRFGTEVMDVLVGWTKNLCSSKDLPSCSVLDIGTGSGRLLQQLAKQGLMMRWSQSWREDVNL